MEEFLQKHFKGDKIIWYVIAGLSVISMLVIYSATGNLASKHHSGNAVYYLVRHAMFLAGGISVIVIVHKIPYKWFGRLAFIILGIAVVLLFIALFSGTNLNSANRWITLPLVGLTFQPSEFAKIALMIFLARELAKHQDVKITRRIYLRKLLLPVVAVIGLIFTEDLSTAILIGGSSMILMFIGRVPLKFLVSTGGLAVGGLVILLFLAPYIPREWPGCNRLMTWRSRVEHFRSKGGADSNDTHDYQASKSELAIANGGLFGQGPGNSVQRYFLPHPYSDFVYAIIIEEFGMFGGIVVLLAYMILLFRAGVIVRASNRVFPALMVMGLTMTLVLQAIINMGVAVGMLPVTGQTLPLVSMGGTSILFSCLALGVILSVSKFNLEEKEQIAEKQEVAA